MHFTGAVEQAFHGSLFTPEFVFFLYKIFVVAIQYLYPSGEACTAQGGTCVVPRFTV